MLANFVFTVISLLVHNINLFVELPAQSLSTITLKTLRVMDTSEWDRILSVEMVFFG